MSGVTSSSALLTVTHGTNPPPIITNPKLTGATFTVSVSTQSGLNYVLEFKNSLSDPTGTPLQTVPGTGSPVIFTDPTATANTRFYRVRIQ